MRDQKKIDHHKKKLGILLRHIREQNKVSTYYLEKRGITFATRQSLENGSKSYTIDTLLHYCEESKIDLVDMITQGNREIEIHQSGKSRRKR